MPAKYPNKYQREWRRKHPEYKEHINKYQREYRKKNIERITASERRSRLKLNYGLTEKDYDEILIRQNNVCALCKNTCKVYPVLCVDHDHATDKIRGLLCSNCNKALGLFKDNVETLKIAISYLEA